MKVPDCAVSTEARHNIFLAVKEALHKALKHSSATQVRVRIGVQGPRLEVCISDNGRGFNAGSPSPLDPARRRIGNGLANMRRRLKDLGGHCAITTAPGQGTAVAFTLDLPLPLAAE
jgi:signal transduction histidine kinase